MSTRSITIREHSQSQSDESNETAAMSGGDPAIEMSRGDPAVEISGGDPAVEISGWGFRWRTGHGR